MLNEWFDRDPEPKRSRVTDRRFWIGFWTVTALVYGLPAILALLR